MAISAKAVLAQRFTAFDCLDATGHSTLSAEVASVQAELPFPLTQVSPEMPVIVFVSILVTHFYFNQLHFSQNAHSSILQNM